MASGARSWVYTEYIKENTPADQARYRDAEQQARQERRGL